MGNVYTDASAHLNAAKKGLAEIHYISYLTSVKNTPAQLNLFTWTMLS